MHHDDFMGAFPEPDACLGVSYSSINTLAFDPRDCYMHLLLLPNTSNISARWTSCSLLHDPIISWGGGHTDLSVSQHAHSPTLHRQPLFVVLIVEVFFCWYRDVVMYGMLPVPYSLISFFLDTRAEWAQARNMGNGCGFGLYNQLIVIFLPSIDRQQPRLPLAIDDKACLCQLGVRCTTN